MDHAARAKRLRDRAEECRVLADIVKSQAAKDEYLELAKAYDALATHEESLGNI